MDLDSFIKSTTTLPRRSRAAVKVQLLDECRLLLQDFQKRSPLDTGHFQSQWHISNVGGGKGISYSIRNNVPYSVPLDEGAPKGEPPWNFPKAGSGTTSKSGKVTLRNNRVWAGGMSPSGFVIGGISDHLLMNNKKRQTKIAKAIADSIIKAI